MFFWWVLNLTLYDTKGLWEVNMFSKEVLNLTQYYTKGLWAAKNVLLKSVKFETAWDKGFVIS